MTTAATTEEITVTTTKENDDETTKAKQLTTTTKAIETTIIDVGTSIGSFMKPTSLIFIIVEIAFAFI